MPDSSVAFVFSNIFFSQIFTHTQLIWRDHSAVMFLQDDAQAAGGGGNRPIRAQLTCLSFYQWRQRGQNEVYFISSTHLFPVPWNLSLNSTTFEISERRQSTFTWRYDLSLHLEWLLLLSLYQEVVLLLRKQRNLVKIIFSSMIKVNPNSKLNGCSSNVCFVVVYRFFMGEISVQDHLKLVELMLWC